MSTFELLGLLELVTRGRNDGDGRALGPTEAATPCALEDVALTRNLWCRAYDRCLDAACRRGWRSWTCEACRLSSQPRPPRS